jgi:hypothetical protein
VWIAVQRMSRFVRENSWCAALILRGTIRTGLHSPRAALP